MKKTVVSRRKDLSPKFENGLSRTEILAGSYDQVKLNYCVMEDKTSWKPELYKFEDKCQIFIFVKGTGYITTSQRAYNITEADVYKRQA